MEITKEQARRFLLSYQSLLPPAVLQGKTGILDYIHRVGCVQYDPLNIVGHNTELVLQARVADFRPEMLRELLYVDRKLIDGWDKMMSIYRTEEWPFFRRWRDSVRRNSRKSAEAVRAVLDEVRAAIEARGPLSSLDLEMSETVDWDWSQSRLARAALESLYFWGELIIHHRVHTRKFYDFARRHLPEELLEATDPNPTLEQYQEWYVHRRIGSVGMLWNRSGEAWLISSLQSKQRTAALKRLIDQGKIIQAHVKGMDDPVYFRSEDHSSIEQVLEMSNYAKRAVVMAPLDNLLWDRRFLKTIFDFDYRWEVYVPAHKRRYGYYVLPVLYGDRFIARFEPGLDKKRGVMTIKNWWWEAGIEADEQMQLDLHECFRRFLFYLGVDRLELNSQPVEQSGLGWLARRFA